MILKLQKIETNSIENLKEQFLGFYLTPSLFKDSFFDIEQFEFDEINLDSLDFKKLQIHEKIPLGKRVERFFEFYILNSKRYDLVLKNIQIIKNKNTLGEIDFILFDNKNQEYLHVELIYKFYIYEDRFKKELQRYIGPNKDDSLIKKLDKLKTKQLPLLYKDEAKEYLKNIDFNNIKQKICFKANLFFSNKNYNNNIEPFNKNCKKGLSLKYSDFIEDINFKNLQYYVPHRFDWISNENIVKKWHSYEEIIDEIKQFIDLKKAPLLWIKDKNKINQYFILW